MKKIFLLTLMIIPLLITLVNAQENEVCVDLFYSETCPHCDQEKIFMNQLKQKYPTLIVNEFEVHYNQTNRKMFEEIGKKLGVSEKVYIAGVVPTIFINGKVFVGFSEGDGEIFNPTYQTYLGTTGFIEKTIQGCLEENNCSCLSDTVQISSNNIDSTFLILPGIIVIIFILIKLGIIKLKVGESENK